MSKAEDLINRINSSDIPEEADVESALSLTTDEDLGALFACADKVRTEQCGDGIALRGLIEFSNICERDCFYCGLNNGNAGIPRYRMAEEEILESVKDITSYNIRTVVMQSGEDSSMKAEWLRGIVTRIKEEFDVAITLSVGQRDADDYKMWRDAGADRYLLKIEAYDEDLYNSVHLRADHAGRLKCLNILRDLGYQVGTGNIIGLPGQTLGSIARDIIFFNKGDFDMVSVTPFIPHDGTRLRLQEKGDVPLTLKAIALTRITTKNAHMPATTALGSMDRDYRSDGLSCGANVLMPNFTPRPYRRLYEIYPGKRCVDEPNGACNFCMDGMARNLGRYVDRGRGDTLKGRKANQDV